MNYRISRLVVAIVGVFAAMPLAFAAQSADTVVVPIAVERPVSALLPDVLAGLEATSELLQVGPEKLDRIVADESGLYKEYGVAAAANRTYGNVRVDVFRTSDPFGAFGLYSHKAGVRSGRSSSGSIGSTSAWLGDRLVFWQGNLFVQLSAGHQASAKKNGVVRVAEAVSSLISSDKDGQLPPLLDSLPDSANEPLARRYLLGPEAVGRYIDRGEDMFRFDGDAEAVAAEYPQGSASGPLKFLIIEYHTPQFAHDGMEHLGKFLSNLSTDEQNRTLYRREGNYIVYAGNVSDRALAEKLVNAVKYPYGVKWLKPPLAPGEDPFYGQKVARVLVSTFGLVGLGLLTAAVAGAGVGSIMFMKRRKRLREIFSDAGGMLRLDIDPVPGTALTSGSVRPLIGRGQED